MADDTEPKRIALFGATGGTGGATLRSLITEKSLSSLELRLLVRSKAKLLRCHPQLASFPNVHTWEGQVTDTKVIKECIQGADIIICALGENRNIPGVHVLQDLSKSIIDCLSDMKNSNDKNWKRPRVILLSSATWNHRLSENTPAPIHWLVKTAFYYPYVDLLKATAHFEACPDLLSLKLVQPPAIVEDGPSGMEISTDSVRLTVFYADLGAAFANLAMREQVFDEVDAVGVSSHGGDSFGKYGLEILKRIVIGLVSGYVPGYWQVKSLLSS
ncbi:Afli avfa cytochrome p450 monooxygenase [Fusarium albosuccineum]|uniref:Afli avfa cytochrome p450 monooxygenase n=1 Tax=Fusarium albosuccineum TaxID=1237068 RepID=A0A8H4LD25_9HYPO|nr:Afli avfa cytochrome p450 monooxygenase [Fusarium albosuccineum]